MAWKLILLFLAIAVTAQKGSQNSNSNRTQRQKNKFKDRLAEEKRSLMCMPFETQEAAYNCARYRLSPECFHKFVVTSTYDHSLGAPTNSRGLELGEENSSATDSFYQCCVMAGLLGT